MCVNVHECTCVLASISGAAGPIVVSTQVSAMRSCGMVALRRRLALAHFGRQ